MNPVPKVVDKDSRRRRVADALHRIASREGLEGISIRTVAAEAGLSAGAVQREFPTKDELLHFALRASVDEVAARLGNLRLGPEHLSFTEGLRRVLSDLLPTDQERLAQARTWSAYYARAAVDPAFAETLSELDARTREALLPALHYAQEQGELAPGRSPEDLVDLLLVLIDGLWLTGARTPPGAPLDGQRAAVDAAVALVTGSP